MGGGRSRGGENGDGGEAGAVTGLMAGMGLAAAEATIGGNELLALLVSELRQRGSKGAWVGGRGAATEGGAGGGCAAAMILCGGGAKVHGGGVVGGTGVAEGGRARGLGGKGKSAAHDDIIKAVGEVTHVLPRHAGVVNLAHEKLLDLGLEAVDEVKAQVGGVAVGQVGDDALELIGVGLDGGGLLEGPEAPAGFVLRVGVSKVAHEGRGEFFEGGEAGAVSHAVGGAVRLGAEPCLAGQGR